MTLAKFEEKAADPLSANRTSFAPENNLTETQRTRPDSNENTAESTELIDIPALTTVWSQRRVLPGPPVQNHGG